MTAGNRMPPEELPKLPIGWQGFEDLRLGKAVYVDKTGYLPMVRKAGRFVFCARPRRFGKSLTVTALDAFYSGRIDLFRGLEAEKVMDSGDFVARPVIRLDMLSVAGSGNMDILERNFIDCFETEAKKHKVSLRGADSACSFSNLIEDIHEASGKRPAILIDEYDSPVIFVIQKGNSADEGLLDKTRDVMRKFYSRLNTAEEHIESVFITGITKFSQIGVLSLLNNLVDISIEPEFGAFMGFTHDELEKNFKGFIVKTADRLRISEKGLLRKISNRYNGFSFDGATELYNPFGVLSFFNFGEFDDFWMGSGSNTVIRDFFRENILAADRFQNMAVDRSFAESPGEIDATSPEGFLYQAGYLTLMAGSDAEYALDYPNSEVRRAISTLFLESLTPNSVWNGISELGRKLKRSLARGDVPGMIAAFTTLLSVTVRDGRADANSEILHGSPDECACGTAGRAASGPHGKPLRETGPDFFRSILHAGFSMAGAALATEKRENMGLTGLAAVYGRFRYIIELEMTEDAQGADDAVKAGMLRIHDREYGRGYRNPFLVSLAIGRKERNIVACLFERDGFETSVEIEVSGKA